RNFYFPFEQKKATKRSTATHFKLESYIMDIKEVKKGSFIGYGNSFMAETNMKVASVPVGYGYGYSRSLSNQGRVIVNHNRLSIVGIINMNMLLIDITMA